jgi:hypothetical protein
MRTRPISGAGFYDQVFLPEIVSQICVSCTVGAMFDRYEPNLNLRYKL